VGKEKGENEEEKRREEEEEEEDEGRWREEEEGVPKAFRKEERERKEACQIFSSFSLLVCRDDLSGLLLRLLRVSGDSTKTSLPLSFRVMLASKMKDTLQGVFGGELGGRREEEEEGGRGRGRRKEEIGEGGG
jgi:hypothetical protein